MKIHVIKPAELTADHQRQWARFQETNPLLESPYFRPEFTLAVAAVRRDVEVALLEENGEIVGFFPFQRGTLNLGKPVGGKLSDYHGLIAAPETAIDPQQLLRACRLSAWDFDHLPATQTGFQPFVTQTGRSPQLDVSGGIEGFQQLRKAAGSDVVAKTRQKYRKFEREIGPLEFVAHTTDRAVLRTLMEWKSAQYLRTGIPDVFSFPWTGALLDQLLARTAPEFCPIMTTLSSGGKLLSIFFALRSGSVVHNWFTAYDPTMSELSPSLLHYLKWIEAAPNLGIGKIDLGRGEEAYKWRLATGYVEVAEGTVGRASLGLWLRGSWRATKSLVEASPLKQASAIPAKLIQPLRSWLALS